jgi:enoyl-CoA hydratase
MIEISEGDGIAIVQLAHGKANAMDTEFCDAVTKAFAKLKSAKARAVVLTGQGGMFSAGVNLIRARDGGAPYIRKFLPVLNKMFDTVFHFPKPVVAAINGHAIAGGCVLACCADRRLMARETGRMGITELLVGLPFPALAFEAMRFAVSPQHFPALVYSGATFPPEEAHGLGLIDEVIEPAVLLDRAVADAQTLAALSSQAFAVTKRQLRLDITERMKKHGPRIDAEAAKIWASAKATDTIRDYVAKRLGK